MTRREWGWTERGKDNAKRNGVEQAEVIDALYSPRQIDNEVIDLMYVVCGQAQTGRLITVLLDRVPWTAVYKIIGAREASPAERDEWERKA